MFQFKVSKTGIDILQREDPVSGTRNSCDCQFLFSEDWTGLDRTAVFFTRDRKHSCILGAGNICCIPWEVLEQPGQELYAGVYGTQSGAVILATAPAKLGMIQNGVKPGEISLAPTPDVYDQILAAANEALADVAQLRAEISAGNGTITPGSGSAGGTAGPQIDDSQPTATSPYSGAKVSAEDEITRQMADHLYPGTDLTVKFVSEIQNFASPWDWIKSRIQVGNFTGIHIKDFIPFSTKNGLTFHAEIAGIDTYYRYGEQYTVGHHIDFISRELWPTDKNINPGNFNNGTSVSSFPWLASELYLYLNALAGQVPGNTDNTPALVNVDHTADGILLQLPDALQAVIIEKQLMIDQRYTAGNKLSIPNNFAFTNIGKLWVPNEFEVCGAGIFGDHPYSTGGSGVQYPLFIGNMNRIKTKSGASNNWFWWLLTAATGNTDAWCSVFSDGRMHSCVCNATWTSFPLCFRIA